VGLKEQEGAAKVSALEREIELSKEFCKTAEEDVRRLHTEQPKLQSQ
jgi:hypothetical protein